MKRTDQIKPITGMLFLGILGCVLMASSDWIMIYGDPSYEGALTWLTVGVGSIPPWRNTLALALAFPAVICYAFGLFAIRHLLPDEKHQKTYSLLTALGLTPWLSLHLFYVMIFFLFSHLTGLGYAAQGAVLAEALVAHFGWLIPASEVLMLLPYVYLFCLTVRRKSVFSPWMALNNPLILFAILKLLIKLLPDSAFRLAFLNGLMSEAMLIWFAVFLAVLGFQKHGS